MVQVNRLLARYPLWFSILIVPLWLTLIGLGLALLAGVYVNVAGWAIGAASVPLFGLALGLVLLVGIWRWRYQP